MGFIMRAYPAFTVGFVPRLYFAVAVPSALAASAWHLTSMAISIWGITLS
jgi:hypothetical protein